MQSDEQLIGAILDGRRDDYAELIRRYEGSVRAVAIGVLHHVHDAEEAAQEAFIKAYEKLPMLRKRKTFGPWLMRIARNTALDQARKRTQQPQMQPLDGTEQPGNNGKLDDLLAALLAAVIKLPRQERQAVMMHHFDRQPVRTVAGISERSVGTVTKQLSRAYARLRHILSEHKP